MERKFSYHLSAVRYLGTIEKGSEKLLLANVFFVRSSAEGSLYPPGRGHGFLLCLKTDFALVSQCRLDFPEVDLHENELKHGGNIIANFAEDNEAIRRRGFLIDGDDFLPYPFSDKLPAKDVLKDAEK